MCFVVCAQVKQGYVSILCGQNLHVQFNLFQSSWTGFDVFLALNSTKNPRLKGILFLTHFIPQVNLRKLFLSLHAFSSQGTHLYI